MSASAEYTAYVLDRFANLAHLGQVETCRFFGGVGLRYEQTQFAVIMDNTLYFVVNDTTRSKYERAGMTSFSYSTKKGRVHVRRYFALPEEILDDPQQLLAWMGESVLAAQTKRSKANQA